VTFWQEVGAGFLSNMFAAILLVICYIGVQWFLHATDVLIGYNWSWKGSEFHPNLDIRNRSKSRAYVIANIAYKNGNTAPLWIDNKSLWAKELKPGSINFFNDVVTVKNVNSLQECLQIRVVVRLQTGREFWLTGHGPGQEGKVVMGRFQKLAFAVRNFLEKGSVSIDMN
jgi:hypothetical protein